MKGSLFNKRGHSPVPDNPKPDAAPPSQHKKHGPFERATASIEALTARNEDHLAAIDAKIESPLAKSEALRPQATPENEGVE